MTMKQLQQSMDMMRSACAPKFKNLPVGNKRILFLIIYLVLFSLLIILELLDGLRRGEFVENKDLKVMKQ